MGTLTPAPLVTREPKHAGYDKLDDDGIGDAPDEFLVFVDGEQVGGTYWGGALEGPDKWCSWGPAGQQSGLPSREAAEQVQVAVHVTLTPADYRLRAVMDDAFDTVARIRHEVFMTNIDLDRLDREPGADVGVLLVALPPGAG